MPIKNKGRREASLLLAILPALKSSPMPTT